jgi:FlaA1/EpsC-like NDP-sugar epimerase
MSSLKELLFRRNTPRWIVFLIDTAICLLSLLIAYQVRFNFDVPDIELSHLRYSLPTLIGVRITGFLVSGSYKGIIRYTGSRDAVRIFYSISVGSLAIVALNIGSYLIKGFYLVPFSILIIDTVFSVFALASFRAFVKLMYQDHKSDERKTLGDHLRCRGSWSDHQADA